MAVGTAEGMRAPLDLMGPWGFWPGKGVEGEHIEDRMATEASKWMSEHRDEPFFLYFPQAMPGSTRTPFASRQCKGKSKNGPYTGL